MSVYKYLILLYFLFFACGTAQARTYPAKPLRLLVPFAPGGGADRVGLVVHSLLPVKNVKALSTRARIVKSAGIKIE